MAGQPRHHVVQLRQFHLQLAFAAARVASEDVQDQLRPVDHAAFGGLFDIALLHGRKIAVENNQRNFVRGGFGANLVELAAADQSGGIGGVANLEDGAGDVSAGAARELDEFRQRFAALFGGD